MLTSANMSLSLVFCWSPTSLIKDFWLAKCDELPPPGWARHYFINFESIFILFSKTARL